MYVWCIGTAALSAEKANPEDEEEDLCNAQFSLAYGILPHYITCNQRIPTL